MATALLRGLLAAGVDAAHLRASDVSAERRAWIERELGIKTAVSNLEVAAESDVVLLAVKPGVLVEATAGLARDLPGESPLFVSIMAGCRLDRLARCVGPRVVRAMPNTPALIGAGISALCVPPSLSADDAARAEAVLAAVGGVVRVPESALDAVTGLSGSGPAYVLLMIEAMTDAGVREGLPAATARELAAATVAGSARLALESGEHPAVLRERVTSPGGTTAAGLAALEEHGLRTAVMACVRAATARAVELAAASEASTDDEG